MKNRITIGLSSIILILLILCLSVFSLLSLSDAKTALSFAERRAASVKAWYEADTSGQEFLYELSLIQGGQISPADKAESLADSPGPSISRPGYGMEAAVLAARSIQEKTGKSMAVSAGDSGHIICEIPMPSGQALHIEIDGQNAAVLSYYVYNSEEYEIDDRLPVWDGGLK